MLPMTDKRRYISACKHLPFTVDVQQLQAEVASLPAAVWGNSRAPVHQETVSVFLRGQAPMRGATADIDQPLLRECPYINRLLHEVLPGRCGKCLLASLRPGGLVYPHTDVANDYFLQSFRVHVPVFTNDQVYFFSGRRLFHMAVGQVWSVNNLAPHAVMNLHPHEARVHLIFDIFPDAAAIELMERLPEEPGMENETLLEQVINQRPPGIQNRYP
jgi:hypothetical protein